MWERVVCWLFLLLPIVAPQWHSLPDRGTASVDQIALRTSVEGGVLLQVAAAPDSKSASAAELLRDQLASVEKSQDQVNDMLKDFQGGIKKEQAYEISEAGKAKKMALSRTFENSKFRRLRTVALLREKRRRIEVNRCLSMLRGGRDAVYVELMNLFAATATELLCPTLKAFEFPALKLHGFHEPFYLKYKLGPVPQSDGSQILFYKAAKSVIWRCMCEEKDAGKKSILPKAPKLAVESQFEKAAREASADVLAQVPKASLPGP